MTVTTTLDPITHPLSRPLAIATVATSYSPTSVSTALRSNSSIFRCTESIES